MQTKMNLGIPEPTHMTREMYIEQARAVGRKLLQTRAFITTDDIRKELPIPAHLNPKIIGNVVNYIDFVSIGWTRSRRQIAHHRPIQMFRLRRMSEDETYTNALKG